MKYNFDKIINREGTNSINTDGYLEYIFGNDKKVNLNYSKDEVVRMWIADMGFATASEIVDAIKERLDHPIFGYTQVFDSKYYKCFSEWTSNRYGFEFEEEHLVTSHGIIPALFEIIEYTCEQNDKVLIITPSYAYFKHAADHNNIEIELSELINDDGNYYMDFEDIEQKAKDERVKLCLFCNPHNPTGRKWSIDELKRFGEICLKNNVVIVSDEIHCDLLRKGEVHTPLAKLFPDTDKIITCMSTSKTFNIAGFKFANVIIPDDEIRDLWKKRHYSFENPLSIVAAQAAYEHGSEWLAELTDYLDANFRFVETFLESKLPKVEFTIPKATYFVWIDISEYVPNNVRPSLFFANNAGVILEDGNLFVSNAEGYIRLNIACPISTLEKGLNRILEAIETSKM